MNSIILIGSHLMPRHLSDINYLRSRTVGRNPLTDIVELNIHSIFFGIFVYSELPIVACFQWGIRTHDLHERSTYECASRSEELTFKFLSPSIDTNF